MRRKLISHSRALRKTICRIDELGQGGDRLFESWQILSQSAERMPQRARMQVLRQAQSCTLKKKYPTGKGPHSDTSQ